MTRSLRPELCSETRKLEAAEKRRAEDEILRARQRHDGFKTTVFTRQSNPFASQATEIQYSAICQTDQASNPICKIVSTWEHLMPEWRRSCFFQTPFMQHLGLGLLGYPDQSVLLVLQAGGGMHDFIKRHFTDEPLPFNRMPSDKIEAEQIMVSCYPWSLRKSHKPRAGGKSFKARFRFGRKSRETTGLEIIGPEGQAVISQGDFDAEAKAWVAPFVQQLVSDAGLAFLKDFGREPLGIRSDSHDADARIPLTATTYVTIGAKTMSFHRRTGISPHDLHLPNTSLSKSEAAWLNNAIEISAQIAACEIGEAFMDIPKTLNAKVRVLCEDPIRQDLPAVIISYDPVAAVVLGLGHIDHVTQQALQQSVIRNFSRFCDRLNLSGFHYTMEDGQTGDYIRWCAAEASIPAIAPSKHKALELRQKLDLLYNAGPDGTDL